MGRPLKVSRRTRSILRALNAAPAKSSEQKKLEKEQARQARLKLKAEEKAAREAAKHQGPAQMVVQVASSESFNPADMHRPPGENPFPPPGEPTFTLKPDADGRPVKVPELPTPAAPEPAPEAVVSGNPDMPPWIREGRNATREEWFAWQRDRGTVKHDSGRVEERGAESFHGWHNPGGVVERNSIMAHANHNRGRLGGNCFVAGYWPGRS